MTEDRVIDVETGEIIVAPDQPSTIFGAVAADAFIERASAVATALKKIVDERKLFATIQGKQFPTVEAWTLIGSMVGASPIVEWTRPVLEVVDSVETVIGYEARVEVRNLDGRVIGAAEAMCTRKESTWRNRDDYALRSMAQTRATSKALRGPLDFIMKLAGYQGTPAEEMPKPKDVPKPKAESKKPSPVSFTDTDAARDIMENMSREELAPILTSVGITRTELEQGPSWVEALPVHKIRALLDALVAWEAEQPLPWDLPLVPEKKDD